MTRTTYPWALRDDGAGTMTVESADQRPYWLLKCLGMDVCRHAGRPVRLMTRDCRVEVDYRDHDDDRPAVCVTVPSRIGHIEWPVMRRYGRVLARAVAIRARRAA